MRLWNRPGMPAVGYSSARRVAPLPTHPPQTPPHHCEPHRCAPILHRQTTPMDEFETPAPTAEGGDDMGFGADMGASEPLPTFGEAEEPLPTFGESEPLPTFGDAEEAAPMGGMDMGGGDMGGMGGDMGGMGGDMGGMGGGMGGDMGGMGGDMGGMGGDMGGMGGGMGGGEPAVMSDPDPPPGVFWRRPMEPTRGPTRCPPALPAPPRPCPRLSLRQTLARLPPSRVSAHLSLSRPPPSLPPSRLARTTSESAHLVPLGPAGLRASP
jgi:hypothetical protein